MTLSFTTDFDYRFITLLALVCNGFRKHFDFKKLIISRYRKKTDLEGYSKTMLFRVWMPSKIHVFSCSFFNDEIVDVLAQNTSHTDTLEGGRGSQFAH